MNILIDVREYGSAYHGSALLGNNKKVKASSTASDESAARAVAKKVLGNFDGDEPRLMRIGIAQFMADVVMLEGFDSTHGGICCRCAAMHKIMFKKDKKIFCGGCAHHKRNGGGKR
jgi:hypothetical protein